MKKQASKKTPTSVGAECCTGPDLECLVKDAERSCPKERLFGLRSLKLSMVRRSSRGATILAVTLLFLQSCVWVSRVVSWGLWILQRAGFKGSGWDHLERCPPDRVQNTYAGKVSLPQRKLGGLRGMSSRQKREGLCTWKHRSRWQVQPVSPAWRMHTFGTPVPCKRVSPLTSEQVTACGRTHECIQFKNV